MMRSLHACVCLTTLSIQLQGARVAPLQIFPAVERVSGPRVGSSLRHAGSSKPIAMPGTYHRSHARQPVKMPSSFVHSSPWLFALASLPRKPFKRRSQESAVAMPAMAATDSPDTQVDAKQMRVRDLATGQEMQGTIVKLVKVGAFVDVGADRLGLIPRNKLRSGFTAKVEDVVQVGERVTTWVSEASDFKFILSLVKEKAQPIQLVDSNFQSMGSNLQNRDSNFGKRPDVHPVFEALVPASGASDSDVQWLDGKVSSVHDYGAFVAVKPPDVDLYPVQGLLHNSQMKAGVAGVAGEPVRVRVLSVQDGKLGLSMRAPSEVDVPAASNKEPVPRAPKDLKLFEALVGKSDAWLTGHVASLSNVGAFVTVQAPNDEARAQGLVHITQIAEEFIEDPGEVLEIGQEVRVRVRSVNLTRKTLGLTMLEQKKQKGTSANQVKDLKLFEAFVGKSDAWLNGSVASLSNVGAFVTVQAPNDEAKAQGLVHITQIAEKYIEDPAEVLEVGQEVRVRVRSVNLTRKTMGLTMLEQKKRKGAGAEPTAADFEPFVELVQKDDWLPAEIISLADFGAFAMIEPPGGGKKIMGLLHVSQLVNPDMNGLVVGDKVSVRVFDVDVDKQRLTVSQKPLRMPTNYGDIVAAGKEHAAEQKDANVVKTDNGGEEGGDNVAEQQDARVVASNADEEAGDDAPTNGVEESPTNGGKESAAATPGKEAGADAPTKGGKESAAAKPGEDLSF